MTTSPASPARWFHEFGRAPRILGLDVARGLAILGMVGAHIGETRDFDWPDPDTWSGLVHGRSSILFAVLAGVSIALMTGRGAPPPDERMPRIRLSLVGRGAAIFLIGLSLELLNTPIAVILTLYGLLYVAVIPFLRWRARSLLAAAAVLALLGPALLAVLDAVALHPSGAGIDFVLYGSYPITAWMAFVLGGLALGRLDVERTGTVVRALVVGVVLAVVGYGLGALGALAGLAAPREGAAPAAPAWAGYPEALEATDPAGSAVAAFLAVDAHSGGTAEILGSGGLALAVVCVCLLLARPLRWPLLPLAALGSMPLTAYSAHVLSVTLMSGPGSLYTSDAFWGWTAVLLMLGATVLSISDGRGPLERLVGRAATAMARYT